MFRYFEHVGLLNDEGDRLARTVQRLLVRAGLKDASMIAVSPWVGRRLILRHGGALYRVEVHTDPPDLAKLDQDDVWLPLFASRAWSPSIATHMAEEGLSYLDESGNAHVVLNSQTVVFAQEHSRASHLSSERTEAITSTPGVSLNRASHKIVFVLLCDPELAGASVRLLADAAEVSTGTAHSVVSELTHYGYLRDDQLHQKQELLDLWLAAFRRVTFEPLSAKPLYARGWEWAEQLMLEPDPRVLLGGAAGAGLLTGELRSTDGVAYVSDAGKAIQRLRLTPTRSPFRVEMRERFWNWPLPTPRPGLVPSVLLLGDLLRDGDSRSVELAINLREHDAHLRSLH